MNEVRFSRQVKEVKFGAWVLDPKRQSICDGEITRELEPLLFRLLCYLIINNEQIITRQDLVDDVWNQNYVDDNAINRAMSELRKILKSDKQRGIVIKTHYRKGYSFFLEPDIIYHANEDPRSPSEPNPDKNVKPSVQPENNQPSVSQATPNSKYRFKWFLAGAFVLSTSLLGGLSFKHYYVSDLESDISNIVAQEQSIKESVLSWVQGRYTLLNLSPNDAMVAYSFIQEGAKHYSLVVKNLQSGHERRLGEPGVNYYPVGWSADSSTIYYSINDGNKCQVWELSADFNSGNQFLFECKGNSSLTGGGVNQNRLVYAKQGYRSRDELSALTNRDLTTGDEFQITSPNLNSYGDRFLAYIPEKEIILFERRQYNTNELYMTDPDGGDQIKLYESRSRIWALNYDDESDSVTWFDNSKNVLYRFSLLENRLINLQKLKTEQSYAEYETLSSGELLMTSYPFNLDVYTLDLNSNEFQPLIQSNREDRNAIKVPNGFLFLTRLSTLQRLNWMTSDGKVQPLGLPDSDFKSIRYNSKDDELLVHYTNKIEIYKLSDLTLKYARSISGTIVSVEYLNDDEISYTVVDETKISSKAYVLSSSDKKVRELPTQSILWLDRLSDDKLVTLSSNDTLSVFDLKTGDVTYQLDLPPAKYRHSVAVSNGYIYHSDGESIYKIDLSSTGDFESIYTVNESQFFIDDIRRSDSEHLILDVIEVVENQLLKVSLVDEPAEKQ
ncbi:winged helix-turn-helix domain-containing protein [Pseudoalteromonas luteoviolacea]|uniref:OmpR/PhoB-type domain-containing protein n=1 Tax=Pseudoalteromonas luteoviolacea S4054 TaxID=1129367 RepID=A0A0F6AAE6_9GAMM|nr:winged helix-turn-helix domain-containing protein [Pseudoalteromonas luteoviolacea]AOT10085.1 hypothetical protein S4054249_20720 [Pseudoalteromonas luteoviolacea]AOT14996.1 hypothetical protein S40542_20685 [Pseudoalteromonas luteoviolacea]AOT19912.1 hypothetical protein S4054_20690 [Pseudoalteromonas luteoviolacea]KKE82354.1 hypothetical protein N479_01890 [Pseudoalteromonas luteoviolacea S4054]KZN77980.1 hypothetical protein N481_03900 [Pseudoalteromonas luteoviolacea S4047-1]